MFAKTALFFVAFVALVDAAPVVGLRPILEPITTSDLRPLVPVTGPNVRYKLETIASKRDDVAVKVGGDLGNEIGFDFGSDLNLRLPLLKRDYGYQEMGSGPSGSGGGLISGSGGGTQNMGSSNSFGSELTNYFNSIGTMGMGKRDTINLPAVSQISAGLSDMLQGVQHLAEDIQQLMSLLNGVVSNVQTTSDATNNLAARDIVIDSGVLLQLQSFVVNTVNLLNALGKSDAVNTFLSEVNNLKAEARNGNLDAGDLLDAARDIIRAAL